MKKLIPLENLEYYADEDGNIYNHKGHQMKPQLSNKGYFRVQLKNKKNYSIHLLVAITFITNPHPFDYQEINHKDGDKLNNHKDNLEWCNRSQNIIHSYATGLQISKKGEDVGNAKLTNTQAKFIRDLLAGKRMTQQRIADAFGVSRSVVNFIKNNKKWTHLV